ncbi:MAG: TRAP transporter large permease subunit [Alphaproteobacteria bacterium]|nr:TRAP transporter large permease subunit [Alphaproteobacteria bacterium]
MTGNEILAVCMMVVVFFFLATGFPVAFALAGSALFFGLIGYVFGDFSTIFFGLTANRIYGVMSNEILIAVPLFVFMGIMLERSKVAESLLETMGQAFGPIRGGLGVSVCVVGGLLAASTGIVGATVMAMGLISLPVMLRRGYDPAHACGLIAACGTLGQIIPPSIVLVVLGDQISNANIQAQRAAGKFSVDPVSVGDLFAGALIPGIILVLLYIIWQLFLAWWRPNSAPAVPRGEFGIETGWALAWRVVQALVAPVTLILAVLGSILGGVATPTEGAAVGAVGATMLGGLRAAGERRVHVLLGAACALLLIILTATVDLRLGRDLTTTGQTIGIWLAMGCCAGFAWGLLVSLVLLHRQGMLASVMRTTSKISAMAFSIVIGAQIFSLVFRGLGGDDMVHEFLRELPGGKWAALALVMFVMFILGFALDFLEITFIVVPLVAPPLLAMGVDPIWLAIMMAVNLQTEFLTPPFGFALFYIRAVAPASVTTMQIYRGIVPFVCLQLVALGIVAAFPALATWLPKLLYG